MNRTMAMGEPVADFLDIIYMYYTKKLVRKCTSIDRKSELCLFRVLQNVYQSINKRVLSVQILTKCTSIYKQNLY